jgi:uncharacterized iron-regulated protein
MKIKDMFQWASALGFLLLSPGSVAQGPDIVATPAAAASVLRSADVIILGEIHDNPTHHLNQAQLIEQLTPSAVVFEMLSPAQADMANGMTGREAGLRDAIDWPNSGWPDWSLYEPVFVATGSRPMYGAALSRESVRRAVGEGAAAVFGDHAEQYGLADALPSGQQTDREAEQMAAHCDMLPPPMLPGMVEAQRLRDAAFARTVIKALAEQGPPVVLIAGAGHARTDWGVPAALARAAPGVSVASLGQVEDLSEPVAPYDVILRADSPEREDPCLGLQQMGSQ